MDLWSSLVLFEPEFQLFFQAVHLWGITWSEILVWIVNNKFTLIIALQIKVNPVIYLEHFNFNTESIKNDSSILWSAHGLPFLFFTRPQGTVIAAQKQQKAKMSWLSLTRSIQCWPFMFFITSLFSSSAVFPLDFTVLPKLKGLCPLTNYIHPMLGSTFK